MEPRKMQPMNINISWIQPWPTEHWTDSIDDAHLEMLIQDMLCEDIDTTLATEMLNDIGIKC